MTEVAAIMFEVEKLFLEILLPPRGCVGFWDTGFLLTIKKTSEKCVRSRPALVFPGAPSVFHWDAVEGSATTAVGVRTPLGTCSAMHPALVFNQFLLCTWRRRETGPKLARRNGQEFKCINGNLHSKKK